MDEIKSMLENEVARKKIELVSDLEELEEERESNDFLKQIAEDYHTYNTMIMKQKEKQVCELQKILDYLDELVETQAVTQYTLNHTKTEQRRVVDEIKELQKDMKKLNDEISR